MPHRSPGVVPPFEIAGQPAAEPALPIIGVVLDTFPAISETFIFREIGQLVQDGVPLALASIHRPASLLHSEAAPLAARVAYRPSPLDPAFWRRALPEMRSHRFWKPAILVILEALRASPGKRLAALAPLWHLLPTAAWMAAGFRQCGVKHVHSHFLGYPALVGRLAAGMMGVTSSISIHGSDLHRPSPFAAGNVRHSQFVLTCTGESQRALLTQFHDLPGLRAYRVYHGLDLQRFPLRIPERLEALQRPGARLRIVCVARLAKKKGIDILIRACSLLRRSAVPFHCDILGDGPEREGLENLIGQLNLDEQVIIHGARSQDEVLEIYRQASVMALPCRVAPDGDRDGIPNVLVEAMASGLPVVSTPIGSISELVTEGVTGRLTQPESPQALANALAAILADPEPAFQMAVTARQRVEREFDLRADPVRMVFVRELADIERAQEHDGQEGNLG
jgi:glycosyltransferase involved in cell wall biosynthesis